ncbi:Ig-like domain-containing protein [Singulisphaera sp. PoT]|uniref:Ig-like domain-containing protein n=1 Tax=Singulisphaera sp. PoT TaxID=3411797 RepID=UPI003BF5BE74
MGPTELPLQRKSSGSRTGRHAGTDAVGVNNSVGAGARIEQAPTGHGAWFEGLLRGLLRVFNLGHASTVTSDRGAARRKRLASSRLMPESLELRLALSATPAVVMGSATTKDSHGVTIDYNVTTPPDAQHPLMFSVYRSADATLSADDTPVGSETLVLPGQGTATLDDSGQVASAVGHHQLTIPLPDGLPLNPEHPYVLVTANAPQALESGDTSATASFRVYTIGVVTHGGIQNTSWKNGPPWQLQTAYLMQTEGYDEVLPFNWVQYSNTAGDAVKQVPRLYSQLMKLVDRFPSDAVVDLHLIGHSEGTMINSQLLLKLGKDMPSQLQTGWIENTLLDPHSANTGGPGTQYSVAGNPLGWIAKGLLDSYQSKAKDPLVVVPDFVDQAQVFYQQTPASKDHGTNGHIYNLWGQVPVKGKADYFNLTAAGATHSGKTGVSVWYMKNVAPYLGDGAPEVLKDALRGQIDASSGTPLDGGGSYTNTSTPTFSGTSSPGSTVYFFVAPANKPTDLVPAGKALTDADGHWSITTRNLRDANYRTLALAALPRVAHPHFVHPRLAVVPTTPMGKLIVDANAPRVRRR